MIVNTVWKEEWRYGNEQVMIASDGVVEYRLKCTFDAGKYIVGMVKVEMSTGKEEPATETVIEYASSANAQDSVRKWGENIANKWLEKAKKGLV